jgi:CDP-diacylglycerol--glycerol-3-phosphate 3-phosphatidyltransferase
VSEPVTEAHDLDAFLDRWSSLHGGVDPRASLLVRAWLTAVHACASPLARRRVPPDVLTLGGLGLAVVTVPVAVLAGRWALLVAGLTAVSALLDSLDGAVAVLSGRVTRWGGLLDALCDRCGDLVLALALALLVLAPGRQVVGDGLVAVVAAGALVLPLLLEYVRARAGGLGLRGLDVVTAGERPTRLIVVMMFALAAGVTADPVWALAGLGAVAVSALSGSIHLLWQLRRHNR